MSNIALYLSSRNNYDMVDIFLKNTHLNGFCLYNVDDCSTEDEIKKGKEICSNNNITFIPNEGRGLQHAAQTMINEVKDTDVKFIVWCTHDTFPLTDNFFGKLNTLVSSDKLQKFGMVGFNTFGPQIGYNTPSNFDNKCGMLGRAPLTKLPGRGGWYRSSDMDLSWDKWGKPCSIDAPVDMLLMINVELFQKYIEISDKYHLFCAHDDIALQFLYNNIHNIVLPEFMVWHDQHIKSEVNIPVKSAQSAKNGNNKYFGDYGPHLKFWKERWGWDRDDRETFTNVRETYKGTLIYDMYYHDYKKGPFEVFDI